MNDPGICKTFPNFKLSEYLIESLVIPGQQKIKKIRLASNPTRISYRGKEVVISRYDYFMKLKQNHMEVFEQQ